MKKLIVTLCMATGIIAGYGQNNIAIANKIQGFYIFTDNQPLAEYDVLGEVNTNNHNDKDISNSGGQYTAVRDYLIRSARQVNYTADGLIISLVNGGVDKGVIIKFKDQNAENSKTKVSQFQGIYLFTDCEPINETKYLGTVKVKGGGLSGAQYSTVRDKLIKKCKEDYSNAKGIVIKFVTGGADTADAVEF